MAVLPPWSDGCPPYHPSIDWQPTVSSETVDRVPSGVTSYFQRRLTRPADWSLVSQRGLNAARSSEAEGRRLGPNRRSACDYWTPRRPQSIVQSHRWFLNTVVVSRPWVLVVVRPYSIKIYCVRESYQTIDPSIQYL